VSIIEERERDSLFMSSFKSSRFVFRNRGTAAVDDGRRVCFGPKRRRGRALSPINYLPYCAAEHSIQIAWDKQYHQMVVCGNQFLLH
jgi:hypothetical protein